MTFIDFISACLDHSVENEIPLNVARALYRLGNYLMRVVGVSRDA